MNSPLILAQKNLTVRLYFGLCGGDFLAIITAAQTFRNKTKNNQ